MVNRLAIAVLLAGCHGGGRQTIFNEVDGNYITELVKEMSGVTPVTVGGMTFMIDERYSDTGREHFLAYWQQYMTGLGLAVRTIDVPPGPRSGTDLEAVLPGASPDSFIVIVHYDIGLTRSRRR